MRHFAFALLLASCAGTQPPRVNQPAEAASVELPNPKPATSATKADSGNVGVKAQEPKRRLLGLLPPKKAPEKNLEVFAGRKFKNKGTIIIQNAPGNTAAIATKPGTMATGTEATAVDAARAKAPVQGGTGNWQQATDNTKAGSRGGAAATAPNAQATATTEKENWLGAVLPWAGGALFLYSLLPLGLPLSGWLLAVLLRRGRSREPESG